MVRRPAKRRFAASAVRRHAERRQLGAGRKEVRGAREPESVNISVGWWRGIRVPSEHSEEAGMRTTPLCGWGRVMILTVSFLASCATVAPQESQLRKPSASRAWRLVTVPPTTATSAIVNLQDPGKIVVVTAGPVCGESVGIQGHDAVVALAGNFTVPEFADRATVFLNGWSLRYLQSDEEVKEIGAVIREIALQGKQLRWKATGRIADNNGGKHYEFCYVYTVLAWSSAAIPVIADHRDIPDGAPFYNGVWNNGDTALARLPSYRQLPFRRPSKLPAQDTVAILPRGFRFEYEHEHNILQLALNIDHNDFFLQAGKDYGRLPPPLPASEPSRIDPSMTTWDTVGILKDNDVGRRFDFEQQCSTLTGTGLSVIRPAYSIAPAQSPGLLGACSGNPGSGGIRRERVEIRNLAFDYAVPLLSGWNLDYGCNDEHVTQVGIWFEEVIYERNPGEPTGVLRYTVASVLRDKDFTPVHAVTHKVDIVGINSTAAQ
jgi:hypothetical protein